jgi:hypothetical protein
MFRNSRIANSFVGTIYRIAPERTAYSHRCI